MKYSFRSILSFAIGAICNSFASVASAVFAIGLTVATSISTPAYADPSEVARNLAAEPRTVSESERKASFTLVKASHADRLAGAHYRHEAGTSQR